MCPSLPLALLALFGSLCYLYSTLVSWGSDSLTYSWAFGLNMAGSVLSVLAAVLIATNNPPPSGRAAGEHRGAGGKGANSLRFYRPRRSRLGRDAVVVPSAGAAASPRNKNSSLLPLGLQWASNV